jgi:hypothetical protein
MLWKKPRPCSPSYPRAEKALVLQWTVRDLGCIPRHRKPSRSLRGEPCIVRTRVPVWVLEQARRLGTSEAELLRGYPTLRAKTSPCLGVRPFTPR